MSNDDETTDPDAPPTRAEQAEAEAFAELVDGMLDGAPPPPALAAEERTLLETATMVRAAASDAYDLDPETRRSIVDDALAGGAGVTRDAGPGPTDELGRRRLRKLAPWVAVAAATAAAAFFALRPPRATTGTREVVEVVELPAAQRSRPADALVGRIDRSRAGDARARIDAIYADRSAGYRAVRFGPRLTPGGDQ